MLRIALGISIFAVCWCIGGSAGLGFALFLLALLGVILPPPVRRERLPRDLGHRWEKIEPARRGSEIDPTRPDDHPLMLTNEIKRRR